MNEGIKTKILENKKAKYDGISAGFKNKVELDFLFMDEVFTRQELKSISIKKSYKIYTHNRNFFLLGGIIFFFIGIYANIDNLKEFYNSKEFSKIIIMESALFIMIVFPIIIYFRRKFIIMSSKGISFGINDKIKRTWEWNKIFFVYYKFTEYDESIGAELIIRYAGGHESKISLGSTIQYRELGMIIYKFMVELKSS